MNNRGDVPTCQYPPKTFPQVVENQQLTAPSQRGDTPPPFPVVNAKARMRQRSTQRDGNHTNRKLTTGAASNTHGALCVFPSRVSLVGVVITPPYSRRYAPHDRPSCRQAELGFFLIARTSARLGLFTHARERAPSGNRDQARRTTTLTAVRVLDGIDANGPGRASRSDPPEKVGAKIPGPHNCFTAPRRCLTHHAPIILTIHTRSVNVTTSAN